MRRLLAAATLAAVAGCTASPPPRAVVFFPDQGTALDENGLVLVRQVAVSAQAWPRRTVAVLGFASQDGVDVRNRSLAEARAATIAEQLRREGVAPERIAVRSRGVVPFEQTPLESRRVEITIDP